MLFRVRTGFALAITTIDTLTRKCTQPFTTYRQSVVGTHFPHHSFTPHHPQKLLHSLSQPTSVKSLHFNSHILTSVTSMG